MYPELRMDDRKAINQFLRTAPYAKTTKRSYGWALERLGRWIVKCGYRFESITPEQFVEFLDSQTTWGDNLKNTALRASRAYLRFTYGETHPLLELRIRKPSVKPQRTLSKQEVETVVAYLDDQVNKAESDSRFGRSIRDLALFCLLLDTGLRSSEVCSLEIPNLDLDERTLQAKIKGGEWGHARFTDYTKKHLEDWLDVRSMFAKPEIKMVFVGILGNSPGKPMSPGGLRAKFRVIAKRAGVKHFSTHALRRTGATLATINGGPSRAVRMAWRWKSERQLDRYTQMLPLNTIDPYLPLQNVDTEPVENTQLKKIIGQSDRKEAPKDQRSNTIFID